MRKIQQYLLPSLIAVSALSVSASAAFYSVSGLSKLFAGAALAVIIMATSLEVAKLVIASLLYQYRKTLPKFLKYYLSVACFVLILITSMGIYGFLSAAYQKTASVSGTIDAQITLVETKRDNIKEQLNVFNTEKESINKSVTDLRNGLSNNVITYTNSEGQVMTSTSSATRRALEKQLDQAIERQTSINTRVDDLNEKLFTYETEIVEVSTNNELTSELGPLKFLSELTGIPMNKIINVLLLIIIFVFDPLAIALVIAANFAFEQIKPKEEDDFSDLEGTVNDRLGEIEDWDEGLEEIIYGSDLEEEDDLFDTWYENMEFPLLNEPLMQAAEEYEATTSEEQIVEEEIPQLNMDIAKDYMHARPGYKPPNSIQADDGMGGKVY
tara:strand:+ start:2603 stop:3754 length:1152 start_codon:yes stop_codon:yes gene_type:complete